MPLHPGAGTLWASLRSSLQHPLGSQSQLLGGLSYLHQYSGWSHSLGWRSKIAWSGWESIPASHTPSEKMSMWGELVLLMDACRCANFKLSPNLFLSHILRAIFPIFLHDVVGIQLVSMGQANQVRNRLVVQDIQPLLGRLGADFSNRESR